MKRYKLKTLALTLALISFGAVISNELIVSANADEWKIKDNAWHLLDAKGKEKTGWQQVDERWYYLNNDGSIVASKWIKSRGKWYYLGSNGAMVTNNTVDNCELGSDGAWITNVGIDEELTEQLREYNVYHTSGYTGIKVNDFNTIMFQVADGILSKEEAISNLKKMKWSEETNSVDPNFYGIAPVGIYAAQVEKFNVPEGKTVKEITKEYSSNIKLGSFDNLVAYRNADNSITITSISCSLWITEVSKEKNK